MQKFFPSSFTRLAIVIGTLTLSACAPKYDWREVRGTNAPFVILMPAKPATLSRAVDLGGNTVTMTMTAADINGVSFALGTAELPDAAKAQAALAIMKSALVKNINGSIRQEKSSSSTANNQDISIEAVGSAADGQSRLLAARFVARDKRIYQAVVLGREKDVTRDAIDTFLTSFKAN